MAKSVDEIIESLRKVADALEKVEDKENEKEVQEALTRVDSAICCNACQAISSICIPDSTPNKCQNGCTITSFAF